MVLFLGFAAALTGVLLVAFNSGQISNAKMRAMNAADAAAYSGAVWEARSLNYQAYMNRAMIVNEVTIAQSVSLRSWISYLKEFVKNINKVGQFVPYVAQATLAIKNAITAIDTAVQSALPVVESGMRTLNHVEHFTQKTMNDGALLAAREIATEVAAKNGAALSLSNEALWLPNGKKWLELTRTYKQKTTGVPGDGRARLKEVALNSRDGFTNKRDWTMGSKKIQTQIRKQGGTDLIDYDAWKGLDSAEWRNVYLPFKGWVFDLNMGYGGAQSHVGKKSVWKIGKHGDINEWDHDDGQEANKIASTTNAKQNWGGEFPGYRDIQNYKTQDEKLSVAFAVEVVIKDAAIPNSTSALNAKSLLTDGTTIDHTPHYGGGEAGVFALSEACVTFERPFKGERADKRKEYPSLFNPYWRASLAVESDFARATVDLAKKLIPMKTITGDGSCKSKV
jgi:hypothetical protein